MKVFLEKDKLYLISVSGGPMGYLDFCYLYFDRAYFDLPFPYLCFRDTAHSDVHSCFFNFFLDVYDMYFCGENCHILFVEKR